MKTLLVVNSSGRITRSITRQLSARLAAVWKSYCPEGTVLDRDVGMSPPPAVNEAWIAAAFAPADSGERRADSPLALSEVLIEEIERADAVVFGIPMYNFGVPAQLKAYFDQVIRVGRTFAFDPGAAEPYRPLIPSKPVVAIESVGDGSVLPGGTLAHLNFLEPHLATMLGFIGLTDIRWVRAGYDEFQDERAKRSLARAEEAIDSLARELAS